MSGDRIVLPCTETFPYIVLLISVALAVGALVVASTAVFTIYKAELSWFHEVRHPTLLDRQADAQYPVHIFHRLTVVAVFGMLTPPNSR